MSSEESVPNLIDNAAPESNAQVFKDIFAGTVGGIAQVLTGQPFDCVKVRLQSAADGQYNGTLDVVKQLVKNEGFAGFYKGTLTPLIGVGACVSIQFSVNEYMKRLLSVSSTGSLTPAQFFVSGGFAGFANGFIASPIEHIRIRLQTQTSNIKEFQGPIDCFKKIYSQNGVKGVYKGLGTTLVRESIGLGIYFMTFEALVNREMASRKIQRSQVEGWKLCSFGALAGYALWMIVYPVDVLKSKLQTDSLTKPKYNNSVVVLKDILKTSGVKGLYKGFIPTILRAAPANGATFYAFELTMRAIS